MSIIKNCNQYTNDLKAFLLSKVLGRIFAQSLSSDVSPNALMSWYLYLRNVLRCMNCPVHQKWSLSFTLRTCFTILYPIQLVNTFWRVLAANQKMKKIIHSASKSLPIEYFLMLCYALSITLRAVFHNLFQDEQKTESRKKNLLILVLHYLSEEGYILSLSIFYICLKCHIKALLFWCST